jgi:hypothetical protein
MYEEINKKFADIEKRLSQLERGGSGNIKPLDAIKMDIILPPADIGGLRFNETKVSAVFGLKEDGWYHSRDILFMSARNVKGDSSRDILTEYLESEAFRERIASANYNAPFDCLSMYDNVNEFVADIEVSLPEKYDGFKKYNGAEGGTGYWLGPKRGERSFSWVSNYSYIVGEGVCTANTVGGVAPMFRVKETAQ